MLAAIVESSDDAIIGKDLDGRITSWNRGAEKIFGYTALEMLGTSTLCLMPANHPEDEAQFFARIMQGESVEHFETRRQTKDGRLIDVSVTHQGCARQGFWCFHGGRHYRQPETGR